MSLVNGSSLHQLCIQVQLYGAKYLYFNCLKLFDVDFVTGVFWVSPNLLSLLQIYKRVVDSAFLT